MNLGHRLPLHWWFAVNLICLLACDTGAEFVSAQQPEDGAAEGEIEDVAIDLPPIVCKHCDQPPDAGSGSDDAEVDSADSTVDVGSRGALGESTDGTDAAIDGRTNDSNATACAPTELSCQGQCVSSNDIHSCGSCATDCTMLPNVIAPGLACRAGRCAYTCAVGYADCTDAGAGCTSDLTKGTSCGGCGVQCGGSISVCASDDAGSFTCVSSCPPASPSACNGACVNLVNDSMNCGGCGAKCAGGRTCQDAGCSCPAGTHDCAGTCMSNTSVTSCGTSCNSTCTGPSNGISYGTPTCDGTSCGLSCVSGRTPCGSACLDLQTDPGNCGSCGHDCLGGTCAGGACQPFLVVGPPTIQFGAPIASDGTNVIWYDNNRNNISEIPIRGGSAVTLTSTGSPSFSVANGVVAWEGTAAMWTTREGSATPGTQQPFTPFGGAVALNIGATHVGFVDGSESVYDCTLGTNNCTLLGTAGGSPMHAVANANSYFFVDGNNIDGFDFGATSYSVLVFGQSSPTDIAIDSSYVYWIASGNIVRAQLNGSGVTPIVTTSSATYLATDGMNVYSFYSSGSTTYVGYAAIGGGSLAPVATVTNTPVWALAVGGGAVIWSDGGGIHAVRYP